MEEFGFGLFNGYFQKTGVANSELKNDISSLQVSVEIEPTIAGEYTASQKKSGKIT